VKNESNIIVIFPRIDTADYEFELIGSRSMKSTITIPVPDFEETKSVIGSLDNFQLKPSVLEIISHFDVDIILSINECERKKNH